jgi:hypothetical protein
MGVRRDLLLRFLLLYGMLYCSFGLSSPLLPAFLATRGIGSEWLGFLLGVRLLSAPFAGRLADVFGAFRLELALFAIAAAVASLLYLPAHYLAAGSGEPDPSCHAGAAGLVRGVGFLLGAALVSIYLFMAWDSPPDMSNGRPALCLISV